MKVILPYEMPVTANLTNVTTIGFYNSTQTPVINITENSFSIFGSVPYSSGSNSLTLIMNQLKNPAYAPPMTSSA